MSHGCLLIICPTDSRAALHRFVLLLLTPCQRSSSASPQHSLVHPLNPRQHQLVLVVVVAPQLLLLPVMVVVVVALLVLGVSGACVHSLSSKPSASAAGPSYSQTLVKVVAAVSLRSALLVALAAAEEHEAPQQQGQGQETQEGESLMALLLLLMALRLG